MKILELKIPPLLLFAITLALMWATAVMTHDMGMNGILRLVLGTLSLIIGGFIAISGVLGFKRARTTVNPMNPEKASVLVSTGIYQHTRNPMYLGLLFCLFAWACVLDNVFSLFFVVMFPIYMTRFQIQPEERILASVFGQDYETYKKQVRRWL